MKDDDTKSIPAMSSEALNTIAYHWHFIMWHLAGYLVHTVVLTTALYGDGNTIV
jgi:hypothetical protein